MASYYDILGLETKDFLTEDELKRAYRRALLRYHPDKTAGSADAVKAAQSLESVSVDDIALAYKTLSDVKLRQEYYRGLQSQTLDLKLAGQEGGVHRPGLETVDLDSLVFEEGSETWSRSCRCGDEKGFIVTEPELEAHAKHGEITIGCKGCSLWLRILFSVEE